MPPRPMPVEVLLLLLVLLLVPRLLQRLLVLGLLLLRLHPGLLPLRSRLHARPRRQRRHRDLDSWHLCRLRLRRAAVTSAAARAEASAADAATAAAAETGAGDGLHEAGGVRRRAQELGDGAVCAAGGGSAVPRAGRAGACRCRVARRSRSFRPRVRRRVPLTPQPCSGAWGGRARRRWRRGLGPAAERVLVGADGPAGLVAGCCLRYWRNRP